MHHKHRHKLPTLAPAAISASTLAVSGILCALALNLPLFAQTPTPLTVSGSAYTESDATHTTGNINTAGTYAGSGIRFSGAVSVSVSSVFTVDTGTFAAITGTGHSTLALTSATASGAVSILDHSTLTLTSGTFNSTLTLAGASSGTLIGSRVAGATTVREGSSLTVNNSTLAGITGSSIDTFSLQDSAAGNTNLRETGLANIDGSTITGYLYHYNTAATTGTLLLNSSTITGVYTGSNTRITQITNSRIGGATTINNLSGESGMLTVNNSTLAAVTGSNLDTVAITGGTTGALTFRETKTFTLASATTGNLIFNNTTVSGSFTVQNSSVGATGAGTITGSNLILVTITGGSAGGITMRETQELAVSSGSFGAVNLYNTAATPGALTITSATTGAVTGSSIDTFSLQNSTAGNTTLRETGLANIDGSTVTGYVYHYNTAATTGTLLLNSSTITGVVTGSNISSAQITDAKTGNVIVNNTALSGTLAINNSAVGTVTGSNVSSAQITGAKTGNVIANNTALGGTLAINNSAVGAVTGSNLALATVIGGSASTITMRETQELAVSSGSFGAVNLYNTAATPGALTITSATTGAVSGSNVIVTVHDSLAGGASISGSGGLATVTSSTLSDRLGAGNYGTLVARDVRIDSRAGGVTLGNHATGTISNFHITLGNVANYHAITVGGYATATITSGTILTTGGNACGITADSGAQVFIEDVDMDVWGNGFLVTGSSVITANRINIIAHTGRTIWSRGGSAVYFTSGTIHGTTSAADVGSLVDVRDSHLDGIIIVENASTGIFERNNQIAGAGVTAVTVSGTSTLTMRDSTISGGTYGVSAATASHVDLRNTVIDAGARGINLAGSSTATLDNVSITTNDPAAGANAAGISFSGSIPNHLSMTGGAIETASGRGIQLGSSTPSVAVLENVNITTHGDDWANGVYAYYHYNGAFTMTGGTITTHGNTASAAIMLFGGNSTYTLQDVTIHTTGANSQGISAMFGFDFQVTGGSITTEGDGSHGIDFNGGPMIGTFDQVTVTTTGSGAHAVQLLSSATLTLTDSELRTTGEDATALAVSALSSLTLNNTTVTVENNAPLLQISGTGDNASTVTINGGSLAGAGGGLLHLNTTGTLAGTNDITINDADLTRAGGVTATFDNAQTATLTLNGGSGLRGDITATGASGGALALTLDNSSLTGDTIASDHAGITITGINNATITGDVTGRDTSITSVNLSNSTLTGKTTIADAATLTLALDRSIWHMTADSTFTHLALTNGAQVRFPAPAGGGLFHTLTVTGSLAGAGAFAMHADIAAGAADRLIIQGPATGVHQVALAPAANAALPTGNEAPLLLIQAATGDATFATFTGTLAAGIYDYNLQDGAHLVAAAPNSGLTAADATNWYLHRSALSATADAIINTAAMLARDWHYTLDALHLRLGDLRATAAAPPSTSTLNLNYVSNGSAIGNVWARAHAYRLNADNDLTGRAFTQYAYGLTAGADKAFRPAAAAGTGSGATLLAGAFLDMGRTDRDFAGDSATGHTDNLSAGLYGTWLSDTGWHADLVFKADRYKHRFDTLTAGAAPRPVSGAYNSTAQGFSLELGRRLARAGDTGGWWIEPAAQAAIVWLQGAHYRTTPGNQSLDVTLATARAAQYRAQLRFGRQLRDTRWRPYGKFAVVKTDTAGGEIRITGAGDPFAPDYDGWRAEFGMGASYLLDERSQLYFDYEYSQAAHYERPWSLNLGYRVLW